MNPSELTLILESIARIERQVNTIAEHGNKSATNIATLFAEINAMKLSCADHKIKIASFEKTKNIIIGATIVAGTSGGAISVLISKLFSQ